MLLPWLCVAYPSLRKCKWWRSLKAAGFSVPSFSFIRPRRTGLCLYSSRSNQAIFSRLLFYWFYKSNSILMDCRFISTLQPQDQLTIVKNSWGFLVPRPCLLSNVVPSDHLLVSTFKAEDTFTHHLVLNPQPVMNRLIGGGGLRMGSILLKIHFLKKGADTKVLKVLMPFFNNIFINRT